MLQKHLALLHTPLVRRASSSQRKILLPGLLRLVEVAFSTSPVSLSMQTAPREPITLAIDSDWIHWRMQAIEETGGRWLQIMKRRAELPSCRARRIRLRDIMYPRRLYMTAPIPIPEIPIDMWTQRIFR